MGVFLPQDGGDTEGVAELVYALLYNPTLALPILGREYHKERKIQMTKKLISPKNGPAPVGPYSPAVVANGFAFISGQIPMKADGSIDTGSFESQARQVLENLKTVVEASGSTLQDVVKVTIYLTDLANFAELNDIYSEYFDDSKPARACIQAAALPKGVAVEMDAIAICES